jgi:hypothetical protein
VQQYGNASRFEYIIYEAHVSLANSEFSGEGSVFATWEIDPDRMIVTPPRCIPGIDDSGHIFFSFDPKNKHGYCQHCSH